MLTACDSGDEAVSPFDEIRSTLLAHPPNGADWQVRATALLKLDRILSETSPRSPDVVDFYASMMDKVEAELDADVSEGIVIWQMYNHGFLVKTPEVVFAFDMINGNRGWPYALSDRIVDEIDVLFISHWHGDHAGWRQPLVRQRVMANGGHVVVPNEDAQLGNVPMKPGDTLTVGGLFVTAHEGYQGDEDDPNRADVAIFEVTTPRGVTLLHNGDADSIEYVSVDTLDVAILGDSGSYAQRYMGILGPAVTIIGHRQELNHSLDGRGTYREALATGEEAVVMAWGERYEFRATLLESVYPLCTRQNSLSP